jgi:ketosteroid isomerase-like protein
MSEENVEIIRRGWDAYARGDLDAMLAFFAEDMVTVRDPNLLDRGSYRGREGMLESLFEWAESFDEFNQFPVEHIDAGDKVVTRVRQEAAGAQSGVPVATDTWFVFTLRDRKVVRFELFATEEAALEAAGLAS